MSAAGVVPWVVDALIVAGLVVMTLGVLGIYRMPDTYTKLHAQSKAGAFGAVCLVTAALLVGQSPNALRGLLIVAFLALTAPVSAHVIARAAWRRGEPVRAAVIDESGRAPGIDPPEEA